MWFWIWAVLALGALVFYALIGLHLWRRSVKPFLRELNRAAEVTSTLSAQIEELNAQNPPVVPVADLYASEDQRAAMRQRREDVRAARAARKADRLERTYARWRRLGQPF